ncbi:hypothetical protein DFP73DRAFT_143082 [Morchella snyderi]|nr:hypothetical protein DFP73DRAFT_143082 [Morchella snyderi]
MMIDIPKVSLGLGLGGPVVVVVVVGTFLPRPPPPLTSFSAYITLASRVLCCVVLCSALLWPFGLVSTYYQCTHYHYPTDPPRT